MSATDELRKLGGNENRISERLRGVASDMRNIGASSMTPHELFAYWAREVDKAADLAATLGTEINGETSDGYHTFNELYHHRAVLFSVIVENYRDAAWKAKKHHDGTMYDGMFIVGIDTPWGQASYHYDLDPYWDMFDCEEREAAPEWDGHTPDDAIERIGKLSTLGGGKCEDVGTAAIFKCSMCGWQSNVFTFGEGMPCFCPQCGKVVKR